MIRIRDAIPKMGAAMNIAKNKKRIMKESFLLDVILLKEFLPNDKEKWKYFYTGSKIRIR